MASPYFSLLQAAGPGGFQGGNMVKTLKDRLAGGFAGGNMDPGVGPVRFDETTGGWTGVNFPSPTRGGRGRGKRLGRGRGPGGVVPPLREPVAPPTGVVRGLPRNVLPREGGWGRGLEVGMPGGNMPTPPLGGQIGVGAPNPGIVDAVRRGDQGMTGGNMYDGGGDLSTGGNIIPQGPGPANYGVAPPAGPQTTRLGRRMGAFGGGFKGQGVY